MGETIKLVEALSVEIQAYRQRVLTTFRDVAIAQALVTWGPAFIASGGLQEASDWLHFTVRLLAAAGCGFLGWIGLQMITAYQMRIRFCRDNRNVLADHCRNGVELAFKDVFYSTDERRAGIYGARATAAVYQRFLCVSSALTVLVNVVLAIFR